MKKVTSFFLILLLGLAGCTSAAPTNPAPASEPPAPASPSPQSQTSNSSLADLIKAQPVFAKSESLYTPPTVTPALKESESDISKAENLALMQSALNLKLTPAQKDFLQKNKFLILDNFKNYQKFCFNPELLTQRANCNIDITSTPPNPPDLMIALFKYFGGSTVDYERNQANALYVNSDIVLHTYHVFIDRYFKKLEQEKLYPLLKKTVDKLQQQAFSELQKASTPETKASLQRVAGYLTVGKVLLDTTSGLKPDNFQSPTEENAWIKKDQNMDKTTAAFFQNLEKYKNNFSPDYYNQMKAELTNIVEAKNMAVSPLFGQYNTKNGSPTDYTQFTPRSHYNENSLLRAYFRAMMLFGRQTFYFGNDTSLTDAAVLEMLLKNSGEDQDWASLADVTDFFAGASDDITYRQFQSTIENALGPNAQINAIFASDNLQKIKTEAAKLPNPKILSEVVVDPNIGNITKEELLLASKGFRLFGQKFTFDAWVLNQMTAGQEKTDISLPSTPTALFVAAALGSDLVKDLLPTWTNKSGDQLNSDQLWTKLSGLRSNLAQLTPQQWLGNIGSGWLWTLMPLLQNYGQGYPAFMQAKPYQNKNLQTVLGSYTELKHDTLLYAKQSYAELGAGGPEPQKPPKIVKGFVDPDLDFWARMIALSQLTEGGLASRNLLDPEIKVRMDSFIENLQFYQKVATEEASNQPISDDDYENLRTNFWKTSDLIAPFAGEVIEEKDKEPALVADVHTDADKNQILYEATGNPLIMLAFVSDQGTPRLTVGLTYRHFEFTAPIANRITDEEWKQRVNQDKLPETPFFYQNLFVK